MKVVFKEGSQHCLSLSLLLQEIKICLLLREKIKTFQNADHHSGDIGFTLTPLRL